MDETHEIAAPKLSPGFDRARRLSRILVVILTAGFWIGIAMLIAFSAHQLVPDFQHFVTDRFKHPIPHLATRNYGLVVLHCLSALVAIFYARRLFARFAAGDVFTAGTIGVMRNAALWIVIAGFFPPSLFMLLVGIATYIAVYVMAEAARLAEDNAHII